MSAVYEVRLTVGDHEQNGFVTLARWRVDGKAAGLAFISAVDDAVPEGAAGDPETDPFSFILDLYRPADLTLVDTGKLCLPLQMAMRMAPAAVQRWLDTRPEPDEVDGLPALTPLPTDAIAGVAA